MIAQFSIPIIAALIGWFTNYIAIKMLFHPKEKLRLFFFSIQGIFPKRQKAFAEKLGALVSRELFSAKEISQHLCQKATSESHLQFLIARIEQLMLERIPSVIPMAAMFLKPEHVHRIMEALKPDLHVLVGELVSKIGIELEDELDVKEIIASKVAGFSSDKLEEILFSIMKQEFKFVEIIGGILGFIIGVLQLILMRFT